MDEKLAHRIREDANEYGATTGRPRDIVHIDVPMLRYFAQVSRATHLVLTHLDISYPNIPIKVCVGYTQNGKPAHYQPDQIHLNKLKPVYLELPSWNSKAVQQAKQPSDLPKPALQYVAFLAQALELQILMATTGPKRHQTISWF